MLAPALSQAAAQAETQWPYRLTCGAVKESLGGRNRRDVVHDAKLFL